jgi:hypothetical protein
MKAQYIQTGCTKAKPPWTININLIKNWREGGKNKSFVGMGTSGRGIDRRKGRMRVNMVGVFCTCIWKLKNETCWNCAKKRWGEKSDNDGGVNPTKTYFKHICKYQNVSPYTANKII